MFGPGPTNTQSKSSPSPPNHLDLIIQNPDGPLRFFRSPACIVRTDGGGSCTPATERPLPRLSPATASLVTFVALIFVCRAASCRLKVAAAPPSDSQQSVIAHAVAPCSISSCFTPLHKIGYLVRCFVSNFGFRVQLLNSCNELLNGHADV